MSFCVFCAIEKGEIPSTRIHEDAVCLVFMDINPATAGHALVVPRAHSRDLLDTEDAVLAHCVTVARKVAQAAVDGLGADGVNLLQCTGEAAFQSVFHLHIHVIPRYVGDGLRTPWTPKSGSAEEIAASADRIRGRLSR